MTNLCEILQRQEEYLNDLLSSLPKQQQQLLIAGYIPNEVIPLLNSFIKHPLLIHSLYIDQLSVNHHSGCNLLNSSVSQYDQFGQGQLLTADVVKCGVLIYFWPKTKDQAIVDFYHLVSALPLNANIWVIGDNNSGIKTIQKELMLFTWQQLDNARRARIYISKITEQITQIINKQYLSELLRSASNSYNLELDHQRLAIHSLPGVFSAKKFDAGSEVLANYLVDNPQLISNESRIVDYGCGSGVLSLILCKLNNNIKRLTLIDNYLLAMISAKINFEFNQGISQQIVFQLAGNLSIVEQHSVDFLITNPPFHQDKKQSFAVINRLIVQAKDKLTSQGKLLLIANAHLPYMEILTEEFTTVDIVKQTSLFKLYLATNSVN